MVMSYEVRDAREGCCEERDRDRGREIRRAKIKSTAIRLLPTANRILPTAYRTLPTLTISEQSPAPQGPNMPDREPSIFSKPRRGETIVAYEEGTW